MERKTYKSDHYDNITYFLPVLIKEDDVNFYYIDSSPVDLEIESLCVRAKQGYKSFYDFIMKTKSFKNIKEEDLYLV